MKRKMTRIAAVDVVLAVLLASWTPLYGAISWSGDIDPATDPTTWPSGTNPYIGNTGVGSLGLTEGSTLTCAFAYVGWAAGSNGTLTIDGEDSKFTTNYVLQVGSYGRGEMAVTDQAELYTQMGGRVGHAVGSYGKVTIDGVGSLWDGSRLSGGWA